MAHFLHVPQQRFQTFFLSIFLMPESYAELNDNVAEFSTLTFTIRHFEVFDVIRNTFANLGKNYSSFKYKGSGWVTDGENGCLTRILRSCRV